MVRGDWPAYTVARGDTLYRIAQRYSTTTTILSSANCLTNSNRIYVGQVLRVPGAGGVVSQPPIQGANRPITFQPYEGGYMLWWAETGEIWVLSGAQNGSITTYPARSYGSLPDNPVGTATPTNRVRPIMGFGRVWGNFNNVRTQLGWATAPEQSYISMFSYDPASRKSIFTVPGGRTLYSDGSIWNIFMGTPPTMPPPVPPTAMPIGSEWTTVRASYQPFENGYMTWRSDTGEIRVYFGLDNGSQTGFLPDFYGNLPDNPFTNPPAGRMRPILGFGRVWANANAVRDQLGWATAPELGYFMQIQQSTPLVKIIAVPAGANGATRWIFSDRGIYWAFTDPPTETPVPTQTPGRVTTNAAYQPFENGFMTWQSDTGLILVYFGTNGGTAAGFPIDYYGNMPDNPFTNVPAGRVRPINGFGHVWGNIDWVRDQLGWATAPELGYMMQYEPASNLLYTRYSIPAGAGGSIRWISNDRNRFWGYIDGVAASAESDSLVEIAPPAVEVTEEVPVIVPTATAELTVTTEAAYQMFEHGFMIWRADTGDILVFPDHAEVNQFGQSDYENLPDNPVTDTPPQQRLSPINGFGRVWGNVEQVRNALGWALDGEHTYQATLHSIHVPSPDGVKSLMGE
jgi:LysM repeat protein